MRVCEGAQVCVRVYVRVCVMVCESVWGVCEGMRCVGVHKGVQLCVSVCRGVWVCEGARCVWGCV